jgi:hypothetical protein
MLGGIGLGPRHQLIWQIQSSVPLHVTPLLHIYMWMPEK